MRDREDAVSTPAFGVHASFGQNFAVHVCEFFQVPGILQQHGTMCSGGEAVGIVRDGSSGSGGKGMGRWSHAPSLRKVITSGKKLEPSYFDEKKSPPGSRLSGEKGRFSSVSASLP